MRTLLISFEYRGSSVVGTASELAVDALKDESIYVDMRVVLTPDDEKTFVSLLSGGNFDAAFVVNTAICNFSASDALKGADISLDGDGFFADKFFVSVMKTAPTKEDMSLVMSRLQSFFGGYLSKITFKLFGISEKEIVAFTDFLSQKYADVFFQTEVDALDAKTIMFYTDTASKTVVDGAAREFLSHFFDNVYAERDVNLEKMLYDLLKLRRRIISTAESMTGGAIAAKIVSVSGASDVFYEGLVTYATAAKEARLLVEHDDVIKEGVVSSKIAYEMIKGLMLGGQANCAISITGYAEPNEKTPVGLCFIGIGVDNGVEVYRYNLSGDRKNAIATAVNAALFFMIKAIKG